MLVVAVQESVVPLTMPADDFHSRLHRYYEHYAPEKMGTLDTILTTYAGRESSLFEALERKYGREADIPGGDLDDDESMPTITVGGDASQAVGSVGPTSALAVPSGTSERKKRSISFAPPRDDTDSPALAAGPPMAAAAEPADEAEEEERVDMSYRARLVRFYEHYAPEKLSNVDVALRAYKGREETMFAALAVKYGPEIDAADANEEQALNPRIVQSPTYEYVADEEKDKQPIAFDFVAAAKGLSPGVELNGFGDDSDRFAAAVFLIINAIGADALFDATQPTLHFPYLRDRQATPLDRYAFDRVLEFRIVWIDSWLRGLALRHQELAARREIMEQAAAGVKAYRFRQLVLRQAVACIAPIEEERREIVEEEQRLRCAGLVSWFRQGRDELLLLQVPIEAPSLPRATPMPPLSAADLAPPPTAGISRQLAAAASQRQTATRSVSAKSTPTTPAREAWGRGRSVSTKTTDTSLSRTVRPSSPVGVSRDRSFQFFAKRVSTKGIFSQNLHSR
jgi:hypothetical protein